MDLIVYSPLSGLVVPLEEVPDPVFAKRMAGEGLAIDPLDHRVLSPCSGTVTQVHRKRHAVTLEKPALSEEKEVEPSSERPARAHGEDAAIARRLVNAFGGSANVRVAEHVAVTRLRFVLREAGRVDQDGLKGAGTAGVMKVSENVWHVIAGQRAPAIAAALDLSGEAATHDSL
jgi:phosphotransferase system IIB component